MKKFGLLVISLAFIFGSGFLKKNEDGSTSLDTAGLTKAAEDATKQAEAMSDEAAAKIKKAAESIMVNKDEILADLQKPLADIQKKVAEMDTARLVSYLNQYTNVFTDTQNKVNEYTAQLKELKWTQKWGAKGKELKSQIKTYSNQFGSLKEQAELYIQKLESYGVDLSAYGIDLSAYGL